MATPPDFQDGSAEGRGRVRIPSVVEAGQKYGALKVGAKEDRREGRERWACRCDCTRYRVCFEDDLLSGRVVECVACEKWRQLQDSAR